jgi:hypothetical protein
VFTLTLVAVLQELEKPEEERKWHGKVAGIVPYDFRIPTMERLKESCWNPYESRIFTPRPFGIGWAINLYALLENLGFIKKADVSEESFLMPTPSIKEVLVQPPTTN